MERNLPSYRMAGRALLAVGSAIATGLAIAQPTEVVTVEAARSIKTPAPSSVATAREVSLKGWVQYADLDLATSAGASELQKRIEQTAKTLCKELDKTYPLIEGGDCVKNAVDSAMIDARKAIDAKHSAARTK